MSLLRRNGESSPGLPAFFDDFFNRDLFNWNSSNFSTTGTTLPAVNICETGDNFEVEMAAPGMKKEDFQIELDGNRLTISSAKKDSDERTGKN
ncbi:MAG TPA: Hsp20/alpha crystallin family protein, partial [Anseongella sp.]|nr:Hsp20/alpha crystallin family protein [Anseongella sp.]